MYSSSQSLLLASSSSPSSPGSTLARRTKDRAFCANGDTPFQRPTVSSSIVETLPRNIDDAGHRTKYGSNQGDNHSVFWSMNASTSITTPHITYPCPVNESILTVNINNSFNMTIINIIFI